MSNLALIYINQGRHIEAEQLGRQVVEARYRVLRKEHPDTLTSINNLAQVLVSQGKYEEAEQMHRQTLELRERVLGKEHLHTLITNPYLNACLNAQMDVWFYRRVE
ncbi:Tetratricopeptide repeat-domain-containing protein [Camillea tinctor]|nr:Tetratricopeptide repeat-domain-containing protein [Camillea tinctor]